MAHTVGRRVKTVARTLPTGGHPVSAFGRTSGAVPPPLDKSAQRAFNFFAGTLVAALAFFLLLVVLG